MCVISKEWQCLITAARAIESFIVNSIRIDLIDYRLKVHEKFTMRFLYQWVCVFTKKNLEQY